MKIDMFSRRTLLTASAAMFFTGRGLFAEQLLPSPRLTEGPYYPDHLPLDQDNDLIVINDSLTQAVGEITHLSGRVLDRNGLPMKNVIVEIWQCDANQVYLNSRDSGPKAAQMDRNFQGFGRFETSSSGEYRFRTIKPVPYPGRPAPHIHYKIKRGDRELLTSQFMIRGHSGNASDGVYRGAGDIIDRELILADFVPVRNSKYPEYTCDYDIVVGATLDERSVRGRG
jgi:protocatechuate 3,4-dioxygenase beta subunit